MAEQNRIETADGSVYEGEKKNGAAHGFGKMTLKNGDVYEGNFDEGVRHG